MRRLLQAFALTLVATSLMVGVANAADLSTTVYRQRHAYSVPRDVAAQVTTPTETPQPAPDEAAPSASRTITASVDLTPTVPVADSASSDQTGTLPSSSATATAAPAAAAVVPPRVTPPPTEADLDAAYAGELDGTIVANRSEANAQFFLEGAMYTLAPGRSIGFTLPRVTAVLNLFSCDADTAEPPPGCYWDPYVLANDGFYEILDGEDAGRVTALILLAAGNPPSNQVWFHNRTGKRENVIHNGQTYELPPATVAEFPVSDSIPGIFYLRSCVNVGQESRCEWAPQSAEAGLYYALVEMTTSGGLPDSQISSVTLQPVLAETGGAPEAPPQLLCRLQVPAINVRSGPGLQYEIIAKVRAGAEGPATVLVVGKDASGEWLAVDDRVAQGGWVTASSQYILCDADIAGLPEQDVTDGRLVLEPTSTPEPAVTAIVAAAPAAPEPTATVATAVQEAPPAATVPATAVAVAEVPAATAPAADAPAADATATPEAPALTATPEPEPEGPAVPPGLAMLTITNGFQHEIRFTLDQVYRAVDGPSEYDLKPGESTSLLVFPGELTFTASSAWNGLSDNTVFKIAADETANLWLQFVQATDGSGSWDLIY